MSWLAEDLTPEAADQLLAAWHSDTIYARRLLEAGICLHSRSLTTAADGTVHYPPQEYLEPGEALCLECGKVWPSVAEQDAEIEAMFG